MSTTTLHPAEPPGPGGAEGDRRRPAVVSGSCGMPLTIDGFCCADQFVGSRLARAGLLSAVSRVPAPAQLTDTGRALLQAA